MKRIIAVIFLASLVLAGLFLHPWKTASAASLPTHQWHSACGNWSTVSSPNAGTSTNSLNGVAAVGAGNVWAVGFTYDGFTSQTLTERKYC